ncbi:carbonic anhydrase [Jatrophihabitans sp. YIM 134969]
MSVLDDLITRNGAFAAVDFDPQLRINPSRQLMLVGCVDPRVDPAAVLGVQLGEAAVIRNVGGRITPATLKTFAMLGKVGQANDGGPGSGWHLVVLHHTDCGMTDLAAFPQLLAEYFEIPPDQLDGKSVSDPHGSVRVDVDVLHAAPMLSPAFAVSGLVYDVGTGRVEVVVPPAPLRVAAP